MEGWLMKKIKRVVIPVTVIALSVTLSGNVALAIAPGDGAVEDVSLSESDETDAAISNCLEDFRDKTKCSNVSAAVVTCAGTKIYGDADALYQIGSMTKAFTGLAIQKMISEGTLNESDSVSELLPGFTAYYRSQPCEITVAQLLMQTSGYTNKESDYPGAAEGMSLQDWAYSMSGKELNSMPGEEYAYSNVNYNLLGAVIENVSGRSYAEYMETEILFPLGLIHTYAQAPKPGSDIISGSRLGYRHSFRFDIAVSEGKIPAGYFYSNATDMAKWIEIWTGTAEIPEEYTKLISDVKMHLNECGDYYSGWELFENGVTGHSGGTPNYSSRIVFSEEEKTGVCVLTNLNVAASTDGLCNGIYRMAADGEADAADVSSEIVKFPVDVWTVFDIIFTAVSAAAILLTIAIFFMKRRGAVLTAGIILLILLITVCLVMPAVFGAGLGEIAFTWAPYSFAGGILLMGIGALLAGVRFLMIRKPGAQRERR